VYIYELDPSSVMGAHLDYDDTQTFSFKLYR